MRRRSRRRSSVLVVSAAALTAVACASEPERELSFAGPDDDALINAEQLADLAIEVIASWDDPEAADGQPPLDDLRVLLDGEDRTGEAETDGNRLEWAPGSLADGEHSVVVASRPSLHDEDGDVPEGEEEVEDPEELEVLQQWDVTVDATPPELELTEPEGAVTAGDELTVAGTTEPGATVTVADEETTADDDGRFELTLPEAPEGDLELAATDPAGNVSDDTIGLVTVPSRVEVDEVRTVHVSFCAWQSPSLREPIIQAAEDGLITAIQLDLKDETGKIGYETDIEFAERIGSDTPDCRFDLDEAVAELHELDLPVIGRIVAFADPTLAPWAWENDERDMVMQTEAGEMYTGRYAGFANFANEQVLEYNLAVAEEAAAAGVDHILWDYIRKPDGDGARFPGLEGEAKDAIVDFTRRADEKVSAYGAAHGASVYGISADRPDEVAQDIPAMSEHLDYVAPMIYPSHWAPGEYGVADPLMQPYDMVEATLEQWFEATDGTRASIIPWLEDSNYPISLGYPNRLDYVQEQIRATYDADIDEWMLWDSAVNYTEGGMIQPSD